MQQALSVELLQILFAFLYVNEPCITQVDFIMYKCYMVPHTGLHVELNLSILDHLIKPGLG